MDINESVDDEEMNLRIHFRPMANVVGSSLFSKALSSRSGHFSIVGATIQKQSAYRWNEWFKDF